MQLIHGETLAEMVTPPGRRSGGEDQREASKPESGLVVPPMIEGDSPSPA